MTQAPPVPLHMQRHGFDPTDEMAGIRTDEGVRELETAFGARAYLVTRYSDVREVLADSERFSNAGAFRPPDDDRTDAERERDRAGTLLAFDPPEHTRLRRLLTPEFTVRRMRRLEPRIVEIVSDHLDALERGGSPADLVPTFALPIPSLVICELLGVPYTDRAEFQARTGRLLDLSISMDERRELARENQAYMDALVAQALEDTGRGHARDAGPRTRQRADQRRAQRHRLAAAHRRPRDHVEHARLGHPGAAAASGSAGGGA